MSRLGKLPIPIPPGVQVYNIELEPGRGGKIARAAGNLVLVMGILGDNAQIKMPSSEIRLVNKECLATVDQGRNLDRNNIILTCQDPFETGLIGVFIKLFFDLRF